MSEKRVFINMSNPEAKMNLKIKGKNATENALKIMKTFDDACKKIREKERKRTLPNKCKGCDYDYYEDCTEGCRKFIEELWEE